MPAPRLISKSRFCVGLQCLRRLWWQVHEPDAPELEAGARQQAIFDRGHRVGALARERFPGGTLVELGPRQVAERVEATRAALASGAPAVFEAGFAASGVFAALDVLERRRGGWTLVEVKATLDVKEPHLPDVAVQLFAARAAGLDVRRAELMHLNRACAYPDLEDLFVRDDVTDEAEALLPAIPRQLRKMREALEGKLPDVEPGEQCSDPYDCPFAGRCHPELPEHHVSTLYGIRAPRLAALREAGCETIQDLPDGAKLTPIQRRQVRAVKAGRLLVEDGLADALAAIEPPIAFLDFETINPPVPVWDGCHPYEATPVQVSCHVVGARGRTEHHAHLAEPDGDPRPALAEAVVRACEGARTVVAYNAQFEAACLDRLAAAAPRLARPLRSIRSRLVDLLPIVRDHVYHPAFGGRFGLKAVAPALVRGGGYGDLAVADGDTASTLLEGLLLAPEALAPAERARIRAQLLAYCERDTEVLARVHERLRGLASS
jgi:predicted RecB family nuclease